MTNNNLSNPLNHLGSPRPVIYRPKYRSRAATPSYALEGSAVAEPPELPGLMRSIQALEEWRAQDEAAEKGAESRWHPDKAVQLRFYIAPPPNPAWFSTMVKAFRDWESASGGLIRFHISVRPDDADIKLLWTDAATQGREFEVGHTQCQVQGGGWIKQATITLLKQPVIDQHLPLAKIEQRVYTTTLHEVGHALGLEHSTHKKDVMCHQGWQNPGLTPNDVKRLDTLYRRPIKSFIL